MGSSESKNFFESSAWETIVYALDGTFLLGQIGSLGHISLN
jgi:hypothetical protein